MDHRQYRRGIVFLLSDRRQDANLAVPDLENGFVGIAVAVPDVDAMQPFNRYLLHLIGDRVIPVSGQAIDAAKRAAGCSVAWIQMTHSDEDLKTWSVFYDHVTRPGNRGEA
jgi:hypothetical protein